MDCVLDFFDGTFFDRVYNSQWIPSSLHGLARDSLLRQTISMTAIIYVATHVLYFFISGGSYWLLFDKRLKKHPRYIKGQVWLEIGMSLRIIPSLSILTAPWFIGEARGWSKLYHGIDNSPFGQGSFALGLLYIAVSVPAFICFTDFVNYWTHRFEHSHPLVYKHIHKPHHRFGIPTPWASHAFHPLDGYIASLPYHIFPYLFPLHSMTYLGLFVFVNLWTIAIHDSDMIVGHPLEDHINGPSHHTLHHLHFTCNYGQFFTFCDKMSGSYRHPTSNEDPLNTVLSREAAEEKCVREAVELARIEEPQRTNAIEYNNDQDEWHSSDDDDDEEIYESSSDEELATPLDDISASDYVDIAVCKQSKVPAPHRRRVVIA